ncbi:glucoamylase family protein [Salsipaludibacter albus]|uniref:glucoamylase family protein n=1 Tax=Salsipaludibacter albus TaxID=2849650 RepID=UPI001EE4CB57|nr:glucoamylase family protein [Salsipaludibacter albus]
MDRSTSTAGSGRARLLTMLVVLAGLVAALVMTAPSSSTAAASGPGSVDAADRARLDTWARATWESFVAMTPEDSGLPTDSLATDGSRVVQTSTTNIGAYMWSAVAAEDLGYIDDGELVDRLEATISSLEDMEVYEDTGQYYNWYDHRDGAKLNTWPSTGDDLVPHLSSVDNGWLATGLRIVANATSGDVADRAQALYDRMDFGFYYQPDRNQILFHYAPSTGDAPCCYDTIVSESRIASYIGIAEEQIPARHYFGPWRTFPDSCDWAWQEQRPYGVTQSYYGESVFEGAYPYDATLVVPGWGGSAFEDLMPTLFVPEEDWGAASWRINHPVTVNAQVHHGMEEAAYGYWGFSPANVPEGGYREYGVDAVGLNPTGYASDQAETLTDPGFPGCREGTDIPPPSAYEGGVVTPHAAFLGLRYDADAAIANLVNLEADFPGLVTEWGFRDSVNVDTGVISDAYLSLDQGIVMASLANELGDDLLRDAFLGDDELAANLRPVLGVEEFGAAFAGDEPGDDRGCTITGTEGDDHLMGTSGDDVICGLGGDDMIVARDGDDILYGDEGDDRLVAGAGDDTLYGGPGDDRLQGADGDDVLSAGDGRDRANGGDGDDHAEGGADDDTCSGETSSGCEAGS